MKICFVSDTLPFTHNSYSGAEISCEWVANKEKEKGNNVFFLTSKKTCDTKKKVYELPNSHSKNFLVDPYVLFRIYKILKREEPDRIHLFTKKYLIPSVIVAKRLKIPIVYSVVDYHILCPNNILKHKNGQLCTERKHFYCRFRQILFNWLIKEINVFWTFTITSKERMIRWGIPKEKIKVCYQYDAPNIKTKAKLSYPSVVFVGSLYSHKGVDIVIRSMKDVIEKYPSAVLHIVGDGNDLRYSSKLFKFIRENNLGSHIWFHGKFPHMSALRILKGADVAVVAEQWYSDFGPISLYEATKLNVPVVSGNLGASWEFTDNLVEYNNPKEYGKKILELLSEVKND